MKKLLPLTNSSGFSLTECLVAAILFATAVAGVYSTATSMREPAVDTDEKLRAALYGKQILEQLRYQVDASIWDSTDTGVNPFVNGETYFFNDGDILSGNYIVEDDVGGVKKVTAIIEYDD